MTTVRRERLSMPMSRLGPPSNLPRFRWQQPMPNKPTPPNFGLTEHESRHGFNWGEDSILPYQVSDDYDRDLQPGTLDVLVLENGRLKAVVAPSLGGRLLELKDLATGRDLVFRNPVFQPANLAALNAWFSGGIEWNGLIRVTRPSPAHRSSPACVKRRKGRSCASTNSTHRRSHLAG